MPLPGPHTNLDVSTVRRQSAYRARMICGSRPSPFNNCHPIQHLRSRSSTPVPWPCAVEDTPSHSPLSANAHRHRSSTFRVLHTSHETSSWQMRTPSRLILERKAASVSELSLLRWSVHHSAALFSFATIRQRIPLTRLRRSHSFSLEFTNLLNLKSRSEDFKFEPQLRTKRATYFHC